MMNRMKTKHSNDDQDRNKNAKDYRPEPSQPLCVMAPVSGKINVKLNHVSYFCNLCTP